MRNTDKQNKKKEDVSLILELSSEILNRPVFDSESGVISFLQTLKQVLGVPYVVFLEEGKSKKPLIIGEKEVQHTQKRSKATLDLLQQSMVKSSSKPIHFPNIIEAKLKGHWGELEGKIGSFLGVPVKRNKTVIGSLSIAHKVPHQFSGSEQKLLEGFADFMAVKIKCRINEEKRKNLETKYKTIYENIDEGVVLIKSGKIVEANHSFAHIVSLDDPSQLLGKPFTEFSPRFQPDGISSAKKLDSYLNAAKNKKQKLDWTIKSINGNLTYTILTLSIIEEMSEADYLVFVKDISKQKNFEKELIEAKEKAENANHMKSVFLSNMSHEIRTPLNSIIGFSDLLLDEESSSEDRMMYSEMISTAGKSLLQLITDIIDISKIEAGHLKIRKTDFDVHKMLDEMVISYNREKVTRGKSHLNIEVVKVIEEEKVYIHSDEYRFRQILINLLNNAIKFTDTGFIEFGYRSVSSEMIQFFVKDTGMGIKHSETRLIFERFGQAKQDYVENKEGKGLGLAITHSLVRLLGGNIWLDSEPGKGSTFYFTIPVAKNSALRLKMGNVFEETLKNKTILVVDNVEENFHFIRGNLQKTGALFLWARGGMEAVKVFSENQEADLVLMDLQMPDLDGITATSLIRKMNQTVPIIAQTAFNNIYDRESVTEHGFNDIIIKPFYFRDLYGVLTKYLLK
ncbi:MAG: response regulator [Bacteroidales bacterium]|nr:response regulator [Bacteroidales bacterium]